MMCSNIDYILKTRYGIHRIAVTSKMLGFGVNCYFVEKPYPTLVDVPPDEEECISKLQFGLKTASSSIGDIQRIIVTHPHFDHFGSARTLCKVSGAEVWVFKHAARWYEDFEKGVQADEDFRRKLLIESGANHRQIRHVDAFYRRAHLYARSVNPVKYIEEDDNLELASTSFTVTLIPGHTPWCILLYDVNEKFGFVGDFFQNIEVNPLIQRSL